MRYIVCAIALCAAISAAQAQWIVQQTDTLSDTKGAVAILPAQETGAALSIACASNGRFVVEYFPDKVSASGGLITEVTYRLNADPQISATWKMSENSADALVVDTPSIFLAKLHDNDKLFVRAFDTQHVPRDGTFMIANISNIKSRIAAVCGISLPITQWKIKQSKDPLTDRQDVVAELYSSDSQTLLLMQCRSGDFDVMYAPEGFISRFERDDAEVIYRINSDPPVQALWPEARSQNELFVDRPLNFVDQLHDNDKLFVRTFDFQGRAYESTFIIANVAEAKSAVQAACRPATAPKQTDTEQGAASVAPPPPAKYWISPQ